MTGYNTASAPSPMSRTLTTTDATGASYFLHDANKNVMQRTDAEGNLTEKYEYTPFGGNTGEARASIGFSSEAFDATTDLNYYNYRYYAPGLGRWTKRDPIGERGGINIFGYSSNVCNKVDHLGLYGYRKCTPTTGIIPLGKWEYIFLRQRKGATIIGLYILTRILS